MATDEQAVTTQGRACVRLIEAADVLLSGELEPDSKRTLEQARQVCVVKLRSLVAALPPRVTAQILAASEKVIGLAGEISQN